ncbi:DegT/DnrJ/EryC1/StrS family aminotransferase [Marinobacter maroccanus]|nr:DegT/DnrJ/EryC1/StrS family aminotransferase [Marinobacter maroccanus]
MPWESAYATRFLDSGTSALSIAIAIAIARQARPAINKPEVILPGYGCPDLIAAAMAQGVVPVLVDLAEDSPWMNPREVADKITDNTVAIVAVNFLGLAAPLEQLSELARRSALLLIEDSAQRMPPSSAEDGCADLVVLSFGRGKPVNLMGGGALLVGYPLEEKARTCCSPLPLVNERPTIRWALKRQLFNILISRLFFGLLEQIPALRLGETRLHALERISLVDPIPGLLASGLVRFEQAPDYRLELDRELADLDRQGWIRLPAKLGQAEKKPTKLLRYCLLAPDMETRDRSVQLLNQAGIGANAFYGAILPDIPGVHDVLPETSGLRRAKDFASRLITLPVHEDVTQKDIRIMVKTLLRSAQQQK